MKVLILTNDFGGLYCFRKEVVTALLDKGYQVIISAPAQDNSKLFQDLGCSIIETNFYRKGKNPFKDFSLMLKYKKLIKNEKPNVVLSYTIKPNLYGGMACQLCGVPQFANITGLGSAVENGGWLQKLTLFLYKIGLRKTKIVFFQNNANRVFCKSHGVVPGKSILIPGSGVNLHHHQMQPYPTQDEPLRFIFISRLLREKGIEQYLGAAEAIKKKHFDVEFHILGGCEEMYGERLQALQESGVVIYHGVQPDVRPFIGRCHCTVHPSFYPEGMSNVLLESCAAGRPIITTDRPGCGEIVDDGHNGFLVKQQDTEDLIRVLEKFIALPYQVKKELGEAGRRKVEREFDRQIVVKTYLDEICSLDCLD